MKPYNETRFQKEIDKLNRLILECEEDLTVDEFTEKYASEEFKQYLSERKKEEQEQWARGIIVN